jgi:hypothetical protein
LATTEAVKSGPSGGHCKRSERTPCSFVTHQQSQDQQSTKYSNRAHRNVAVHGVVKDVLDFVGVEGRAASEELVCNNAHGPPVDSGAIALR